MLVADAVDFALGVDRGVLVVLTVVEESPTREGKTLGTRKHLEGKAGVLVGGTGGGQEADVVLVQEVLAVEGRPNGRLGPEDRGVIDGGMGTHLNELRGGQREVQVVPVGTGGVGLGPIEPEVALQDLKVLPLGLTVHVLQGLGIKEVVRLEDGDVFALRGLKTLVHGVAVAAVGLVDDLEAGVLLHEGVDDAKGAVGGAIVDADDLDVLKRLRPGRLKALLKVLLDVADWHEHGDERRVGITHEESSRTIKRTAEAIRPQGAHLASF